MIGNLSSPSDENQRLPLIPYRGRFIYTKAWDNLGIPISHLNRTGSCSSLGLNISTTHHRRTNGKKMCIKSQLHRIPCHFPKTISTPCLTLQSVPPGNSTPILTNTRGISTIVEETLNRAERELKRSESRKMLYSSAYKWRRSLEDVSEFADSPETSRVRFPVTPLDVQRPPTPSPSNIIDDTGVKIRSPIIKLSSNPFDYFPKHSSPVNDSVERSYPAKTTDDVQNTKKPEAVLSLISYLTGNRLTPNSEPIHPFLIRGLKEYFNRSHIKSQIQCSICTIEGGNIFRSEELVVKCLRQGKPGSSESSAEYRKIVSSSANPSERFLHIVPRSESSRILCETITSLVEYSRPSKGWPLENVPRSVFSKFLLVSQLAAQSRGNINVAGSTDLSQIQPEGPVIVCRERSLLNKEDIVKFRLSPDLKGVSISGSIVNSVPYHFAMHIFDASGLTKTSELHPFTEYMKVTDACHLIFRMLDCIIHASKNSTTVKSLMGQKCGSKGSFSNSRASTAKTGSRISSGKEKKRTQKQRISVDVTTPKLIGSMEDMFLRVCINKVHTWIRTREGVVHHLLKMNRLYPGELKLQDTEFSDDSRTQRTEKFLNGPIEIMLSKPCSPTEASDNLCKFEYITCCLSEPEVLQVIHSNMDVFEVLYAEIVNSIPRENKDVRNPNLEFEDFLWLLHYLELFPGTITFSDAREMYASASCLQMGFEGSQGMVERGYPPIEKISNSNRSIISRPNSWACKEYENMSSDEKFCWKMLSAFEKELSLAKKRTMDLFNRLDKDGDGCISTNELLDELDKLIPLNERCGFILDESFVLCLISLLHKEYGLSASNIEGASTISKKILEKIIADIRVAKAYKEQKKIPISRMTLKILVKPDGDGHFSGSLYGELHFGVFALAETLTRIGLTHSTFAVTSPLPSWLKLHGFIQQLKRTFDTKTKEYSVRSQGGNLISGIQNALQQTKESVSCQRSLFHHRNASRVLETVKKFQSTVKKLINSFPNKVEIIDTKFISTCDVMSEPNQHVDVRVGTNRPNTTLAPRSDPKPSTRLSIRRPSSNTHILGRTQPDNGKDNLNGDKGIDKEPKQKCCGCTDDTFKGYPGCHCCSMIDVYPYKVWESVLRKLI